MVNGPGFQLSLDGLVSLIGESLLNIARVEGTGTKTAEFAFELSAGTVFHYKEMGDGSRSSNGPIAGLIASALEIETESLGCVVYERKD